MSGMKMKKQIKWWGCCAAALLMFAACSEQKEKQAQSSSKAVIEKVTASATVAKIEKPEATPEAAKKQSIQKAEAATAKNDNGEGREYRINYRHRNKAVKLADYFTDIQYVPLETDNDCLLPNRIKQIIVRDSISYLSYNVGTKQLISLFDSKGRFIRHIGRYGEGPEDYLGLLGFTVSNSGQVSICDRMYSAVITYTTEGEFISRININASMNDAAYLNDSLLIIRNCYDIAGNKYHVLNINNKQVVHSFLPIQSRAYTMFYNNYYTTYQGKILMCEYQNNQIHEVTKDGVAIRYILNINNKMPPKDFWKEEVKNYSEITQKEAQKGYIGHIPSFAENSTNLFFTFRGSSSKPETRGMAVVNKKTGKYKTFRRIAISDSFHIDTIEFYSNKGDGQVIFVLTAEEILNCGDNDFIARFPGLVEDSNPVLLFATLK